MLDKSASQKAQAFLTKFEKALTAQKIDAAVKMFDADCYWRDLVAFTWNIKTMEGRAQVRDMLEHCLKETKPSNWKIAENETVGDGGGVIEAWFTFETDVARGYGLLRLRNGLIWTLLTTMVELKGFEEKSGFTRPAQGRGKNCATRRSRPLVSRSNPTP
jgi:putative flavoprotein involved in K+ transport